MTTKNKIERVSSQPKQGLGTDQPARPRWWRRPVLWLWLLLVLPAGLIAAHAVLWYLACAQITAQMTVELRNLARQGWSTFADTPVRSGYPWVAEVTVPGLRAAGPLIGWETERLVVRLAMLRPTDVRLSAEGRQSLRFADAPALEFRATRAEALINLSTPDQIALEIDGLVGTQLTASSLRLLIDRAAMTATADVQDLGLPAGLNLSLGPTIARLGADMALFGGGLAEVTAPALTNWRDAGGRMEVPRLALEWGAVKFIGQTQIALDAKLQPELTGKLQLGGYQALLDALVSAGTLRPRRALALGAVLGLLARPSDATGPQSVEVPFTVQDRSLSVGRIPLLRVPEIAWPTGK
jgi:hypothetical protein